MSLPEIFAVYCTGAVGYGALELLWRRWTHWSMLLLGGICACIIYWLANYSGLSTEKCCLLSAAGITAAEFCTGILVNLCLDWQVWDYSREPLNLLGQICPTFALVWLGISIPAVWISRALHHILA